VGRFTDLLCHLFGLFLSREQYVPDYYGSEYGG
jgi:hypothetical protein